MRIALFSDIHANLPALESCLESMEAQKPDVIYCLGDLVGYNIWPNEVIREIRRRHIPTIAGNYDQGVGLHSDDCGCAYKTVEEKEMGNISISYTNSVIGQEERQYLRTLPLQIRVQCPSPTETISLLFVHGSPRKINEYLFADRDEKSIVSMMEKADADIMCFGHTHIPYHHILPSGDPQRPKYLHAINTGSVGKPKDGSPQGCYIILTINADASLFSKEAIQVEFIRFSYDVEKAARAIETSMLPDAYADRLRRGC